MTFLATSNYSSWKRKNCKFSPEVEEGFRGWKRRIDCRCSVSNIQKSVYHSLSNKMRKLLDFDETLSNIDAHTERKSRLETYAGVWLQCWDICIRRLSASLLHGEIFRRQNVVSSWRVFSMRFVFIGRCDNCCWTENRCKTYSHGQLRLFLHLKIDKRKSFRRLIPKSTSYYSPASMYRGKGLFRQPRDICENWLPFDWCWSCQCVIICSLLVSLLLHNRDKSWVSDR